MAEASRRRSLDSGKIEAIRGQPNKRLTIYDSVEAVEIMKPYLEHPEQTAHYSGIYNLFYWLPGGYDIDLIIKSIRPTQEIQAAFTIHS